MAAYTFKEMTLQLLKRVGRKQVATLASPTDDALFFMDVLRLANARINGMHPWDWMRTEGEVSLLASLATGTIATSGTGNTVFNYSGALNAAHVGGVVQLTGGSSFTDALRIATITSAANGEGTFRTGWVAAETATATFIGQDTYALPADFDKPLTSGSFVTAPYAMTALDPERFFKAREYESTRMTTPFVTGQPEIFTLWGEGDGSQKLLVFPFPAVAQTLSIRYFRKPVSLGTTSPSPDDEVPDMPQEFQEVLIYRALDLWYRDRELDMAKRAMFHGFYLERLGRMLQTVSKTGDRAMLQPMDNRSHYA